MAAIYKEELGQQIKERRETLGLTQRELAERACVKEATTVSRWERGERQPTDLEAVAKALQTTASEMLSQLSPLHQNDRRALDRNGGTQLDRIEAKLDEMLSRLPVLDSEEESERELAEAVRQAAPHDVDSVAPVRRADLPATTR